MRKSGHKLYEELKKEGLIDFSRDKFMTFLYLSGFGKKVKKGLKTYLEVEDEGKVREILREWRTSLTPNQIKSILKASGYSLSNATLYRYLRKLPKELVVEFEGLGKRYKKESLDYLKELIEGNPSLRFSKEAVTRFPAFPEILDFMVTKGIKEIRVIVVAQPWLMVKEKTFFYGKGDKINLFIIVPCITEGHGLYTVGIKEPLVNRVLKYKGKPTFTSLYIGHQRRNMGLILEVQDPNAKDVSEAILSRRVFIHEKAPDGLLPVHEVFDSSIYEEPEVPVEVYYLNDLKGKFVKLNKYKNLFIKTFAK